jgi:hypothetical protein
MRPDNERLHLPLFLAVLIALLTVAGCAASAGGEGTRSERDGSVAGVNDSRANFDSATALAQGPATVTGDHIGSGESYPEVVRTDDQQLCGEAAPAVACADSFLGPWPDDPLNRPFTGIWSQRVFKCHQTQGDAASGDEPTHPAGDKIVAYLECEPSPIAEPSATAVPAETPDGPTSATTPGTQTGSAGAESTLPEEQDTVNEPSPTEPESMGAEAAQNEFIKELEERSVFSGALELDSSGVTPGSDEECLDAPRWSYQLEPDGRLRVFLYASGAKVASGAVPEFTYCYPAADGSNDVLYLVNEDVILINASEDEDLFSKLGGLTGAPFACMVGAASDTGSCKLQ